MSPEEAGMAANELLATEFDDRSAESTDAALSNPDILTALCRILRDRFSSDPGSSLTEATLIHKWLSAKGRRFGLFDERDYFLGEAAFIAGTASRLLGKREDAFRWLDRSEAGFRHTVNPASGLANVAYARLSLRFEMGRFEDVLDLAPSLTTSFEKLGMRLEAAKCELLRAKCLMHLRRMPEALETLQPLPEMAAVQSAPDLCAHVTSEMGNINHLVGRDDVAIACYESSLKALAGRKASAAGADLKMLLGGLLRDNGKVGEGVSLFRSALGEFLGMGMASRAAYLRVALADSLLALDRPREAEWEILQALPTIEEQKMVPEGFAAVALLRESVKRRKTDPNALRELREHLQKQN
jgi:tetratricopeptide (TPR) repeat protein